MAQPLSANQVIERLCKLGQEVDRVINDGSKASDCFCGDGGFWKKLDDGHYEGHATYEDGYRNDGHVLEFIEAAVRSGLVELQSPRLAPGVKCLQPDESASVMTCGHCGAKYHISLLNEALKRVAAEAYRLGSLSDEQAIEQAINKAY